MAPNSQKKKVLSNAAFRNFNPLTRMEPFSYVQKPFRSDLLSRWRDGSMQLLHEFFGHEVVGPRTGMAVVRLVGHRRV